MTSYIFDFLQFCSSINLKRFNLVKMKYPTPLKALQIATLSTIFFLGIVCMMFGRDEVYFIVPLNSMYDVRNIARKSFQQRGLPLRPQCDNLLENMTTGLWQLTSPNDTKHYDNLLRRYWRKRGISVKQWRDDGRCGYSWWVPLFFASTHSFFSSCSSSVVLSNAQKSVLAAHAFNISIRYWFELIAWSSAKLLCNWNYSSVLLKACKEQFSPLMKARKYLLFKMQNKAKWGRCICLMVIETQSRLEALPSTLLDLSHFIQKIPFLWDLCLFRLLPEVPNSTWPRTGSWCDPTSDTPCCSNRFYGRCIRSDASTCTCPA